MASQKLGGAGRMRCTEDQRRAVFLLNTEYDIKTELAVEIFEKLFNKANVSSKILNLRAVETKATTSGHLWRFIEVNSVEEAEKRASLRERLRQAAEDLASVSIPGVHPSNEASHSLSGHRMLRGAAAAADDRETRKVASVVVPKEQQLEAQASINAIALERESPSPSTPITGNRPIEHANLPSTPIRGQLLSPTPSSDDSVPNWPTWPEYEPSRPHILFRYSVPGRSRSSLNSNGEFVAGAFRTTSGIIDSPRAATREAPGSFWLDVAIHTAREEVDTPFISTSSSLEWLLTLALKDKVKGVHNGEISLIFVDDSIQMYHARTFHRKVAQQWRYYKGGDFRGNHGSEWIVYDKVKASLTIKLTEVLGWAAADQAIGKWLRLAGLHGLGASRRRKLVMDPKFVFKAFEYLLQVGYAKWAQQALAQSE